MRTLLFNVFLIAFIAFISSTSVSLAQGARQLDSLETKTFLDTYISEQLEQHNIPGAVVGIVQNDEVIALEGYGLARIEGAVPFDPAQSVVTAASLSKMFTALAVLQLVETRALELDSDIRAYISDERLYAALPEGLTLSHLLTHTDGFEARVIGGGALNEEDLQLLVENLVAFMPHQIHQPGEHLTYGNFAANLAGYVVAEVSGQRFEDYVHLNILAPLGMNDTTFEQRLSEAYRSRISGAYEYENGHQSEMPFFHINNAPEGGLRTSAADMTRLMLALLNKGKLGEVQVAGSDTVDLMLNRQFSSDPDFPGITYGLFEQEYGGHRFLLRDGDGVGARTRLVIYPEQNIGLFVSYNSGDSNLRLEIADDFLEFVMDETFSRSEPLKDHAERVERYAGTYRPMQADLTSFAKSMFLFSQLVEVTTTTNGMISINVTGLAGNGQSSSFGGFEGESTWIEIEPLLFERTDGHGRLLFTENETGKITSMISGQGYHSPFAKLPWYESFSFQVIAIQLAVLIIISFIIGVLIVKPIAFAWHWIGRGKPEIHSPWLAILADVWAAIATGLFALFVFRSIGVLYAIDAVGGVPNFAWGVSNDMITSLNETLLPAAMMLPIPFVALYAWRMKWWGAVHRVHYCLLGSAVIVALIWANYWNLIGYKM